MLEMRVAKNRETIRGMNVRILSGLRLEVQADPTDQGRYTLKTAYSQLLRSKYQVCILMTCAPQNYDKGLYMIGYETGKIILKFPPFLNLEGGILNI